MLLSGLETQLMLCYLFLYNALDIYTQKPWLAIVVVYLIDLMVRVVRRHFSYQNIAAKSLVDRRFLV